MVESNHLLQLSKDRTYQQVFPNQIKGPNSEFNKGKAKVDVEHIKGKMNRTWKRRDGGSTSNGGITLPKRSNGHSSSK